MLTDAEIHDQLQRITSRYGLFQCQACADALKRWLQSRAIAGVHLMIVARSSHFIISERVGGDISISQNGRHFGIEARGKVFDNLPGAGLAKKAWLADFECLGGFDVEETSF